MVMLTNVIWISSRENNDIVKEYLKELESSKYYKINLYNSIEESLNKIKNIRFEETIIVVDGNIYIKFIEIFQKNINNIYIIPKIIIFTENKDEFINKNKEYEKIINHPFYNSGGIKTDINEINQFILNPICKKKLIINREDDKLLSFEYIDCKEKLLLPIFYKTLIEISPNDNIEQFTKLLCNKYYNKSNDLDTILNSLKSVSDIPIELLSKYYTRIYTDQDSKFYSDINKDLRENKKDNYISYIKVLYEGVKLKSLPLSKDKILYRGSLLLNKEIEKIKKYLNNKIENLPGAIIFSKSFLSFSKDEKVAKYFLNLNENKNKEFSKVLFILEKDENIDNSLSTHADIEELSYFDEKEVLFFPFSSFEIKNINEKIDNNEKVYEIKLLYLGKYIKDIKKDINEKGNIIIPNTEFKKEIIKLGLIKPEIINKRNNTKKLIEKYEEYKEEIINNKNENNNVGDIIKKIERNEIRKINNINNRKTISSIKEINNNNMNKNNEKNTMKRLINIFENNNNENKNENIKVFENKKFNKNKENKNEYKIEIKNEVKNNNIEKLIEKNKQNENNILNNMNMNNMNNKNNMNNMNIYSLNNKDRLQNEYNDLYFNGIPDIGYIIKDLNQRERETFLIWNWDLTNFYLNSGIDTGFTLSLINNNLYEWKFTLKGPKDSPYSGGFFYLKATFPKDYPLESPEICFITPIYHLQVNYCKIPIEGAKQLGHISNPILNCWKSETKMKEVIASIFVLFFLDNPDCPYGFDRAKLYRNNNSLFRKRIQYFIKKYASTHEYKEYSKWDFSCPE